MLRFCMLQKTNKQKIQRKNSILWVYFLVVLQAPVSQMLRHVIFIPHIEEELHVWFMTLCEIDIKCLKFRKTFAVKIILAFLSAFSCIVRKWFFSPHFIGVKLKLCFKKPYDFHCQYALLQGDMLIPQLI